ncbi:hypothetical protein Msub_10579 [Marinobacter subterrani]|uniref:Apea-like HEPN domain-containing protein n=1 Tax=Marinobacter subterrani TaxID=1658765 RepID=A0A0J7J922_9GAMM|nr:hypothetical protein Msub_10579 [Marinobacter subterrani]
MSAVEWITAHVRGGEHLEEETLALVADFTLIWALFEGTEAHGEDVIVVDELRSIAERVSHDFPGQRLDEFVAFWSDRYIVDGSTNNRFNRLNLTHRPHITLVENVLLKNDDSAVNRIHAILLITYRLRNNLFHGAKDIQHLDGQRENLRYASDLLKTALEASGRYIYHNA